MVLWFFALLALEVIAGERIIGAIRVDTHPSDVLLTTTTEILRFFEAVKVELVSLKCLKVV